MEVDPMLQPSSPNSGELLSEFLDGILFSPEGNSLLNNAGDETSLLNLNPHPTAVANAGLAGEVATAMMPPSPPKATHQPFLPPQQPPQPEPVVSQPIVFAPPPPPMAASQPSRPAAASLGKSLEVLKQNQLKKAVPPTANIAKTTSDVADKLVASSDVKPADVICLRGNGGANQPGNIAFRQVISSNKIHFDTLSQDEKEAFAQNLWQSLKTKGIRFLRPTSNNRYYHLLDDEMSTRKCHFALRDCKTKIQIKTEDDNAKLSPTALIDSFDYSIATRPTVSAATGTGTATAKKNTTKAPPTKKHKTRYVKKKTKPHTYTPLPERSFDDTARASIAEMLCRPEVVQSIQNWGCGEDLEQRKQKFADQVLERFRAAALVGISCEEFSERLLPVLLEDDVGESNGLSTEQQNDMEEDYEERGEMEDAKPKSAPSKDVTQKPTGKTLHCPHCNQDFTYHFAKTAAATFGHHTKKCKRELNLMVKGR